MNKYKEKQELYNELTKLVIGIRKLEKKLLSIWNKTHEKLFNSP